jgi:hypothetical protein
MSDPVDSGRRGFLRGTAGAGLGIVAGVLGAGCRDAEVVEPAEPAEPALATAGASAAAGPVAPAAPAAAREGASRPVVAVTASVPTREGAGVHLRRAFGFSDPGAFDPFLLLDDFRSDDPARYRAGFPWHPHRGIETITYVLAGDVEHGDSLGNVGVIGAGDVQWMTAGGGIVHQEMPRGDAQGRMYGFQLWANLPAKDKLMEPRYRDVRAVDIPEVVRPDGVRVKVVAGVVDGVRGPVGDVVIEPEYLDVTVPPLTEFHHPVPREHTVFAYVYEGAGAFGPADRPAAAADHDLVRFGAGDRVEARAQGQPLRFLLVSGRPLREPIAWRGPIVMNTEDELRTAFEEYRAGTFLRHRPAGPPKP